MSRNGSHRRARPLGLVLTIVGVALIIGAVVYGMRALGGLGSRVRTVPLGQTITFRGSWRASIYTTIPPPSPTAHPPACTVETAAGARVRLKSATPYEIETKRQIESSYGFDVRRGTTYLVTCGTRTENGEFGVVEVPHVEIIAFPAGILGALLILTAFIRWLVRRKRGRAPAS